MFKVECPGCQAPYQVDERRVPSSGLKMRCPKCGTSFQVDPPADPRATGPSPVLGAALGGGAPTRPKRKPAHKATMLGVAPGGPAAPPRPAGPPRPAPPRRGVPPGPPAIPSGDLELDDLDLPSIGGLNADLPAPVGTKPKPLGATAPLEELVDFGDLGVELPGEEADLPMPVAAAPGSFEAEELDLPVVGGRSRERDDDGLDLPAPRQPLDMDLPSLGGGGLGEIDLPSVGGGEIGLPQTRGGGGFGEIDLPSPGGDLPAVPDAGLPSPGGVGLPEVGGAGLPSAGTAGLPALGGVGLPQAGGVGLPQAGGAGLPQAGGAGLPQTGGPGWPTVAGGADELELPLMDNAPGDAPWQDSSGVVRQAGGGTDFGEVNLEPGDGGGALEAEVPSASDDMEFGAIPQEHSAPEHDVPVPVAPRPLPIPGAAPAQKHRVGLRAAAAAVVVLALGGASLALVPSVGPFGAFWIADRLQSGEHKTLISGTLDNVHAELGKDTYPAAKRALDVVEQARSKAKRLKSIAAYSVYVIYLQGLRFGADSALSSRAKVLLDELKEEQDIEFLALARASQAASDGQLPRARQMAQALDDKDIDVLALRGELELLAKDPKAAEVAWQAAEGIEKSARTAFGLARAKQAQGQGPAAEKLAQTALKRSPGHVGARTLLARQMWKTEQKEVEAIKLLEAVTTKKNEASPEEMVAAQTLLGDIHLSRSRISHAEAAYSEALKIDPKASGALAGLGDALYRAGRYSEALARFEAGVQADPDDIAAKVGVAKATLALERLQDARAAIKKLRETHPKSMLVAYWHGKIEEASGDRKTAEAAYRDAIQLGGKDPDAVSAHVGLALLLGQQGRAEEAQKVLAEARATLPESPAIHIALGELAQSQGRYDSAVQEFTSALKLDPGDVGAKFRLGAALRRNRQFDEAGKAFDMVAKVDRDYPGLALERGLLYEASGRTDEALKAYESALAKAPNDPDLMLRVGCGKTVSGRAAEAVKLLSEVLKKRPNSAETHHCLGRALLVEGKNLAEALRNLQRAADLDPNRAEYFLFVGWAANEAGRQSAAEAALKKALELDQGLADAYWQRGVLRARQGLVKDAVKDLLRALELRPSRFEAHAALADAYYQLGREDQAMNEWQQAITANPDNATWRYRYGKLLVDNRRAAEAQEQLGKAVELGEAMEAKPEWIYEAHYQLARSLGARKEAIKHWEAFLRGGPKDSPYRVDAKKALQQLGRPWEGD